MATQASYDQIKETLDAVKARLDTGVRPTPDEMKDLNDKLKNAMMSMNEAGWLTIGQRGILGTWDNGVSSENALHLNADALLQRLSSIPRPTAGGKRRKRGGGLAATTIPGGRQFPKARLALMSKYPLLFAPKNPTPKERAVMALGKEIEPRQIGLARRTKKAPRRRQSKKSRRTTRRS
jgi:hypothetical protein